jgi:hypothetical protein
MKIFGAVQRHLDVLSLITQGRKEAVEERRTNEWNNNEKYLREGSTRTEKLRKKGGAK